ncbi:two-component regulator propeller domain-containing protein [uncultured Bacteroides sp.]|uniref:hybrid sensor histidine kinase/response regulator transcription factor n=1 Tax=uncultured Bacteroides sp. TaxID=162156 RepID=UPI002AA6F19B|nr:two-component regulator propeller domain-containing protein [uncultured Bacteroides sp.]
MKLTTLLILFVTLCLEPLSASSSFSFKKYQVEDGLSHNTVWCAMQDSYGFIWFGTSDGLNCFEGRSNKVYRNVLNDKFSLENNLTEALFEEDNHNIWVGTNRGIYIYHRKTDSFTYFKKQTSYGVFISSEVKKIIKSSDGLIWIATLGQGLFIYDPKKDLLTQNSSYTSFAWDICESASHRIYVSSLQEGLLCFDKKGKFIKTYRLLSDTHRLDSYKINCIYTVGRDILLGVDSNVLYKLNESTGEIEGYNAMPLNAGVIRCLLNYSKTKILVGTDNGLYLFDLIDKDFVRVDNPLDTRSLSDQTVNGMMQDAEGGIWVLTNLGGVNYMAKQTKRFDYYPPMSRAGSMGIGKIIGPFCEDRSGNIWIGTRHGLCFFNTSTQEIVEYPIDKGKQKKYDVRSLMLDNDCLWVGTYAEGLKAIDLRTGKVRGYKHSRDIPNTICSNDVLSVYKDSKGDIFVGTSWGLCRYNAKDDNFATITSVGSMISVIDILEDKYGYLWIATSSNGVFRYNTNNDHWKHFQHERENRRTITSNSVITLFEDQKGIMWFGTNGGGLCSFDSKTENFIDFDPQNKLLPNKVIYSIEQDRSGNFWISSNAGLIKINPVSKDHFRRFTVNDGLQGNQFNAQSSLKSSNGRFYFGGINGFNSFNPDRFTDNTYIPPVYITDIKFPYTVNKHTTQELLQMDKPLYMAREITLSYEHNSFSVSFVSLSYEDPSKNRYSYILRGVDKDWIMDTELNTASYTNLPPGKYEFEVRGSNDDHRWNEKGASLLIIITPPWWRTDLAYIFYALLLMSLIFYIGRRWNRYIRATYRRQMEDYQTIKEKEVYKSKISFFINLVHEIRTPLSLIRIPLERMMDENNENKNAKYLSVMDKNVNYLLGIINHLLDFQKMENGSLQLNLVQCDVNQVMKDICNQFTSPAELKGISLTFILPPEDLMAAIDKEKVRTVIVNLIGNALKYASSCIEVKLSTVDKGFEICISDDGPGIPDSAKKKVFEPFYQIPDEKTSSMGTGIGLAFSKSLVEEHHGTLRLEDNLGGGSSFILFLPFEKEVEVEDADEMREEDLSAERTPADKDVTEFCGKKFAILLVEDNTDLLNLTRDSLSTWFRVIKAQNGVQALDLLSKESIDVIISDIMMPEMNGLELTAKVKSDINYSHIPVILLTAKTTLESKVEGFEYGADIYIEKPFSIKQLRMQIENLLKLRLSFQRLMSNFSGNNVKIEEFALSQKDLEFVTRVQEAVEGQLSDENFSVDNLAEAMNMSRSNFYRKIKMLSGMAPNDYLKTLRLNKAAELLKKGARVVEVCEQVGFSSSSYFAKCFKAQFGVLPKDYKG